MYANRMVKSPGKNISQADAEAAATLLMELFAHLARLLPTGVDAPKIYRFVERVRDDPQGVRRECRPKQFREQVHPSDPGLGAGRTSPSQLAESRMTVATELPTPRIT